MKSAAESESGGTADGRRVGLERQRSIDSLKKEREKKHKISCAAQPLSALVQPPERAIDLDDGGGLDLND